MKQSELNHLRRLLGWVRCEIGPSPDEIVGIAKQIAPAFPDGVHAGGQQRLVEWHDKARSVPKYIRDAVKALEKLTGPGDDIGDAEPSLRKLESPQ